MKTEIIYEDKDCLVVYKPAGLACQSAKVTSLDMVSELTTYLKGQKVYLVHRLDQPVEGLLVVAKNKQTSAYFSECVASKQNQTAVFEKSYVACVQGRETLKLGEKKELVDYMKKDAKTSRAEIVNKSDPMAKEARLVYVTERISQMPKQGKDEEEHLLAILRITLLTGRFHQIRAQLSHAGMPILGDLKYADTGSSKISNELKVSTVALCADRIKFVHPRTKKEMQFEVKPRNEVFNI